MKKLNLPEWVLGYSDDLNGEVLKSFKVSVPGIVQIQAANEYGLPSFYIGDHEKEYEWMEDKYWHYKANVPIENNACEPVLCINHPDYWGEIRINGRKVTEFEGMFSPVEVSLELYKGTEIEIEVLFYPVPKREGTIWQRGQGYEPSASCKPAFSYGWDWCPRIATIGICGLAYIEYRNSAYLNNFGVSYILSSDYNNAIITIYAENDSDGILTAELFYNDESTAHKCFSFNTSGVYQLEVAQPLLWWPNGQGEQNVYTLKVKAESNGEVCDFERKIGFRQVKLLPNEGTWDEKPYVQHTQSKFPMQLEINGRKIFAKGTNWVPPEMGFSQISNEDIKTLLLYIKEANMNIIRIWGGGFSYDDDFYSECDRLGIMIWQEFPLACAEYSEDEHYLTTLKKEATTVVRRLRIHPCLALWCGGNELFCCWSGMTPQSHAIRLLNSVCYENDKTTPFLPTSPMYGVGHGVYTLINDLEPEMDIEHLTAVRKSRCTAYTEFGCGAPSEYEYLIRFMSEEDINEPIGEGKVWLAHHSRWFNPGFIIRLSGCKNDIKTIINCGAELQAVMYGALFEEMRRQQPYCSMALNWCYNEPWPTAAGNGLVNYPYHRKPAYYAVKNALRDKKLSLAFDKISWKRDELFVAEIWILNDSTETIPAGEARIYLVDGEENILLERWEYGEVPCEKNLKGKTVSFRIPEGAKERFEISLVADNECLCDSYRLFVTD